MMMSHDQQHPVKESDSFETANRRGMKMLHLGKHCFQFSLPNAVQRYINYKLFWGAVYMDSKQAKF